MAMGEIAGLLSPLIESAAGMSAAFVPMGRQFLALAFLLAIMFALYDWWSGAVAGGLARLVRAGLIFAVPMFLLAGDNWKSNMETVTQFFSKEMTAPILGATGAGSGPDAVKETINKISKSMFPKERKEDKRTTWEKVKQFLESDKSIGGAMFSALTEALFEVILFALALFLSLALVVALYGPLLALQIGVIFGPLLIAWMPFSPLSHLAKNWLQFMLSQGFALVVGVTIAAIGATSIETYTDLMAGMGNDPGLSLVGEIGAKIGGFIASSAVMLFVGLMLFKADDLAAAMIGGGGAGSAGVGAVIMRKVMPTKGSKGGDKPKPSGGDK